jgi:dTDP-4-dehydrorhamnose reductase
VHLTNNQPINKFDLLTLFKLVFVRSQVQLVPYIDYKVDKSLINTNSMFDPKVPSYMQMLEEMKAWIETHPDLYIYSI